jgi:hypothetical protein
MMGLQERSDEMQEEVQPVVCDKAGGTLFLNIAE